jgi:hypothetical protein
MKIEKLTLLIVLTIVCIVLQLVLDSSNIAFFTNINIIMILAILFTKFFGRAGLISALMLLSLLELFNYSAIGPAALALVLGITSMKLVSRNFSLLMENEFFTFDLLTFTVIIFIERTIISLTSAAEFSMSGIFSNLLILGFFLLAIYRLQSQRKNVFKAKR